MRLNLIQHGVFMITLRRMQIFEAVVETGQLTRAAKRLGLSKSAVSHSINELEAYLGTQLLIRNNRHLSVTKPGQDYFEHCQRILSDIHAMNAKLRQASTALSGTIRLTAPTTFGSEYLAPIIGEFTNTHPNIDINMELSAEKIDLVKEKMDFAIRISDLKDSALRARKITHIKRYLCASPAYRAQHHHATTIENLSSLNCLKFVGTPVWTLIKDGQEISVTPKGSIVSNSGEAIREMAIAGQGIAYLPAFLYDEAHKAGKLVPFWDDVTGRPIAVNAVFPAQKHKQKHVNVLVDYIVDRLAA